MTRLRRVVAPVAVLLLLLQSWFAVAHLPAAETSATPVCTASGLAWVDGETGKPIAPLPQSGSSSEHLCCLVHHPIASLVAPVPLPARQSEPSASPWLLAIFAFAEGWRAANPPRAPPRALWQPV